MNLYNKIIFQNIYKNNNNFFISILFIKENISKINYTIQYIKIHFKSNLNEFNIFYMDI